MIKTLSSLRLRREVIRNEMKNSENKLRKQWDGIFHEKDKASLRQSPTQRALSFISTFGAIIDGALLGWKLYRKFKK